MSEIQTPTVHNQCEVCSKSVDPPLRCTVCKNRFYCTSTCQSSDWKQHKVNCSVLPGAAPNSGGSVLAMSMESPISEEGARTLRTLIHNLGVALGLITKQNLSHSGTKEATKRAKEFIGFVTFALPPSMAKNDYPGRQRSNGSTLRHQLVQITRVLVMHTLARVDPATKTQHNRELHLDCTFGYSAGVVRNRAEHVAHALLRDESADAKRDQVRIWPPKLLARPGELSAGEYKYLPMRMIELLVGVPTSAVVGGEAEMMAGTQSFTWLRLLWKHAEKFHLLDEVITA